MTRVALCYFGNVGGRQGKDGSGGLIHPLEGFKSVSEKLISVNPNIVFDTFVHSWSKSQEKLIIDTLQPVDFVIEYQKDFMVEALKHRSPIFDFKDLRVYFSSLFRGFFSSQFKTEYQTSQINDALRLYSRWYSSQKVLHLKRMNEVKESFEYDYVMLLRFDMQFESEIRFEFLDTKFFYASGWYCSSITGRKKLFDKRNLQDYWFISNSKNMDIFATLYDFLPQYTACSHRASYQHVKCFVGEDNIKYFKILGDDYELIRRIEGTEKMVG